MKTSFLLFIFAAALTCLSFVEGFAPHSVNRIGSVPSSSSTTSTTRLNFFGAAKDDGTPGDYVCKDCGYVFTKGPKAWAALDDDDYRCPPCGAPKFRFKKVPKGSAKGKVDVKKSWF